MSKATLLISSGNWELRSHSKRRRNNFGRGEVVKKTRKKAC